MSQAQTSSGREARYIHLLSPVRDLVLNMGIDIAHHLHQYLEELDKVQITFDGGQSSMNFAGAAMLIQNSTWIYSKKVDFLYTLVQQLLDTLHSNKKLQQARQNQGHSMLPNDRANESEEFLSLDDDKQIDPNSRLQEDDKDCAKSLLLHSTPTALIPLDSDERGATHLNDLKGELIGNKNDFNVNSYTISPKGVLLYGRSVLSDQDLNDLHPDPVRDGDTDQLSQTCADMVNGYMPNDGGAGDCGDLSDHDDADNELSNSQDELGKASNHLPLKNKLLSTSERARKVLQLLNPHQAMKHLEKLPRQGKTYSVLKEDLKNGKKKLIAINEYCSKEVFSHASKFPRNYPKYILRPCFETHYYKEYKRRKAMKKDLFQTKILKVQTSESDNESHCSDNAPGDDLFDDGGGGGNVDEDEILPMQPSRLNRLKDSHVENSGGIDISCWKDVTYEDLVRKHTEEALLSAKQAARLTKTAQIVSQWEEKLSTILEEEDAHKPFDIRAYCSKVLSKFDSTPSKQTITFSRVVFGVMPSDVARHFLATLQLANNYNIEITSSSTEECHVVQDFEITLLSRRQHFEDLDEFQTS